MIGTDEGEYLDKKGLDDARDGPYLQFYVQRHCCSVDGL